MHSYTQELYLLEFGYSFTAKTKLRVSGAGSRDYSVMSNPTEVKVGLVELKLSWGCDNTDIVPMKNR